MNYSELTDFDINKLVAESIYKDKSFDHCFYGELIANPNAIFVGDSENFKIADYCNNPNDAWPIITQVWDELMREECRGCGITVWEHIISEYNCSRLRAACIVFLMSK